jgi:hypothetical protein
MRGIRRIERNWKRLERKKRIGKSEDKEGNTDGETYVEDTASIGVSTALTTSEDLGKSTLGIETGSTGLEIGFPTSMLS